MLWSYGNRSNDDFFVYHGFCIADNPYEEVQVFKDLREVVHWYYSMTSAGGGGEIVEKELERVAGEGVGWGLGGGLTGGRWYR